MKPPNLLRYWRFGAGETTTLVIGHIAEGMWSLSAYLTGYQSIAGSNQFLLESVQSFLKTEKVKLGVSNVCLSFCHSSFSFVDVYLTIINSKLLKYRG